MTDDDVAERAEAWDGDPAHQRFFFTRYNHERRQRNRMHLDVTPFDDRRASREEVEAERDRLVALGASVEKVLDGFWGPYEEFTDHDARPGGQRVLPAVIPGGPGGARTHDRRIKSPMLYQLSYRPVRKGYRGRQNIDGYLY